MQTYCNERKSVLRVKIRLKEKKRMKFINTYTTSAYMCATNISFVPRSNNKWHEKIEKKVRQPWKQMQSGRGDKLPTEKTYLSSEAKSSFICRPARRSVCPIRGRGRGRGGRKFQKRRLVTRVQWLQLFPRVDDEDSSPVATDPRVTLRFSRVNHILRRVDNLIMKPSYGLYGRASEKLREPREK